MTNIQTLRLQALLKAANTKKATAKFPLADILRGCRVFQEKKAGIATRTPSLFSRLLSSMRKTAGEQEAEKKESPKADTPKPAPSKSEPNKSESSKSAPATPKPAPAKPATPTNTKPTAAAPRAAAPRAPMPSPSTPKPAAPPVSAGQGTSPGFDWQSVLSTLQPYAAPTAVGAAVGALGSLVLPQGTNPGESAQQYRRRQGQRMMLGGIAGAGSAAALLAAYNAYKAKKGLVMG